MTIEQKYFEVGHNQMVVHLVHNLIEQKLRLPSDYLRNMGEARHNLLPFEAVELTHVLC